MPVYDGAEEGTSCVPENENGFGLTEAIKNHVV
jgi:hypothetical protein